MWFMDFGGFGADIGDSCRLTSLKSFTVMFMVFACVICTAVIIVQSGQTKFERSRALLQKLLDESRTTSDQIQGNVRLLQFN